jgi:hypothetical protein
MLTWRHSIFDNVQDLGLETPVTLPISHTLSPFEVLGEMVHPNTPRVHDETTETASRPDFWSNNLPGFHGEVLEFDIVNQVQVLTQVIFPIESSLLQGPFCAAGIIMDFGVICRRIWQTTEDTSILIVINTELGGLTIRATYPSFE